MSNVLILETSWLMLDGCSFMNIRQLLTFEVISYGLQAGCVVQSKYASQAAGMYGAKTLCSIVNKAL